ncbi:MAG: histidine kinase [Paenibacillaceae bacterium]|nr:histidine kinase [Paenibacillaceae bacterium]
MLKRHMLLGLIGLIFFSFLPLSFVMDRLERNDGLRVQAGVLDLAARENALQQRIGLDGEWEFYWDRLLDPEDFRQTGAGKPSPSSYMQVPSQWNGKLVEGVALPAHGAATYRMVIRNLPASGIYALKKTNIRFASRIFVNGQPLFADGVPALSRSSYKPGNVPQIGLFSAERGDVEIIVQVANYDYVNAGIPVSLYFGTESAILEHQQKVMAREFGTLAVLGTLAMMYVICFAATALYRRRDYSLLLFALFCFLYAVYQGLYGERALALLLPSLSFELLYKTKDVVSIAAFIVLAVLLRQVQNNMLSLRLTRIIGVGLGIVLLAIAAVPIHFYTYFQPVVAGLFELLLIGLLWRSALLYLRGEEADRWKHLLLFLAILFINLYSVDLLLFGLALKESLWLGQLYFVVFNLIMMAVIVLRFFESYHSMDAMKNQLLQLDKIKDDFLSHTSHELKTPLNAIVSITESLLKGVAGEVNDRQAHNLAVVLGSGRRLTHQVNELLDYSKMKYGDISLHRSSTDLKAAVDSVIRVQSFLLGGKPLALLSKVPEPFPAVYADANRLVQILHNLIGNAVKFTRQGSVTITAKVQRSMVEVRVEDTGIGIAPHLHDRIFRAFEQVDDETHAHSGGTGLGLSITKKLVELHGGTIRVESSEREGAAFLFTVPLAEEAAAQTAAASAHRPEAPGTSIVPAQYPLYIEGEIGEPILVVDDDLANLQAMINLFKLERHSIVVVNRGQLALKEIARNPGFFLVILDITMPDMSGYEVLRHIRERFSPFELPVLMLTARNSVAEMQHSMENGANDFVGKPFESEELLARVRSLTQLKASVKNARDAEIAFLRSQINPHFLFNALNSIAALCAEAPEEAEELTLQLSLYLRSSFDFKHLDSLTTLASELELVKAYLNIEKVRFGDRLLVEFDVDADLHARIPPLVLQPLVENAIKHGLMAKRRGGTVRIAVRKDESETILFTVEDDGGGMSKMRLKDVLKADANKMGVGLWNISQRLRLLYGRTISIESELGAGTKVSFSIPPQLAMLRNGE